MKSSIHNLSVPLGNGESLSFSTYKGKKILIVNVASKCGYTKQYAGLQELYEKYQERLIIIAMPCNDFGGQEPGDNTEITSFCSLNYGVTFPIAGKVKILEAPSPIYQWLMNKSANGVLDSEVTWNFCKFLLDEDGYLQGSHPSSVEPMSAEIVEWLEL